VKTHKIPSVYQIALSATFIAEQFAGNDLERFSQIKDEIGAGAMKSQSVATAVVQIAQDIARDCSWESLQDFCVKMAQGGESLEAPRGEVLKMNAREVEVLVRWATNVLGLSRKVTVGFKGFNLLAAHNVLLTILTPEDQKKYRRDLNACNQSRPTRHRRSKTRDPKPTVCEEPSSEKMAS
jgi:hypothetical protein